MLFTEALFIGVDPNAGNRPMHYAALDRELHLVALDQADLEGVLTFIGSLDSAVVGIDAPQSPNQGLLANPEIRRRYNLRPGGNTWSDWRICEYELRQRNIRLYSTPGEVQEAKGWVRTGFELFKRLRQNGFRQHILGEEPGKRSVLEARSHVGYSVLLERRPFLKQSMEGRLQRQLVLYLEGLEVANPMHVLEEITRHNLLMGNLPLERLRSAEQLDAIMAAYIAYLAALKPERMFQIGEREEGLISVPTANLKDFYP
jgi:predicted nuclease with RNAse H fold